MLKRHHSVTVIAYICASAHAHFVEVVQYCLQACLLCAISDFVSSLLPFGPFTVVLRGVRPWSSLQALQALLPLLRSHLLLGHELLPSHLLLGHELLPLLRPSQRRLPLSRLRALL